MNILLVNNTRLPALHYGGTERVIWWLGKELSRLGHKVTFLVAPGSECPFAKALPYDRNQPLEQQVPDDIELIHVHFPLSNPLPKPYLATVHGNSGSSCEFDINTVFVSRDHAQRHGGETYVHNGIDPDDYGDPALDRPREYLHFLAKAAWRVKNVRGAIALARSSGERLEVIGGHRLNFNMGFRLTLDRNARFHGMLGGEAKNAVLRGSKGLLFPVLWHEPFGLGVVESMYFGCPVFATPYGSLPELVTGGTGFLSAVQSELVEAIAHSGDYDRKACHDYATSRFSAARMTRHYLKLYDKVLKGKPLNAAPPRYIHEPGGRFLPFPKSADHQCCCETQCR